MIRPVLVALSLASLAACSPQPRSAAYFIAHPEEAEQVLAACETAAHRGEECVNAKAAPAATARDARMDAYRKGFK
jgi:hypothetical protein